MAEKLSKQERLALYNSIHPYALSERKKIIDIGKPIENSISLLEQLGFFVAKFPSNDSNLAGFCIKKGNRNCIYINSSTTLGRQNASIWHEYYHVVSGEGGGLTFDDHIEYDTVEYKAQCFAGIILMPDELVRRYLMQRQITMPYIKFEQLAQLSIDFKVSYIAALTRLIQVFPEHEDNLSRRYGLAKNQDKLLNSLMAKNISTIMEISAKDIYVSQSFFTNIEENYELKRISKDKMDNLISLLESIEKKDE